MPVEVQLVKEGRVTLTVFTDPMDMREAGEANEKAERDFLSKATRPVHAIIDCTALHRLPSNILSSSLKMSRSLHPMTGEMVIVVQNSFVAAIANLMRRTISSHKISVYPTMPEAWAYIDRLLAEEKSQ